MSRRRSGRLKKIALAILVLVFLFYMLSEYWFNSLPIGGATCEKGRTIHLVMPMVLYSGKCGEEEAWGGLVNIDHLVSRQKEFSSSIIENLNHVNVCSVYLLTTCEKAEAEEYVATLKIPPPIKQRLFIIPTPGDVLTYNVIFKFMTTRLVNKLVMFVNADNILGGGYENVDENYLRENRLLYAITRTEYSCDKGVHCAAKYIRSHDGWMFVPTEPFPEEVLRMMEYRTYFFGRETATMWILHHKLKYQLLNPCRYLEVFQHHCSELERNDRIRIDLEQSTEWGQMNIDVPYSGLKLE